MNRDSPLSPELRQLVSRNPNVANLYKNALSYLSESSDSDLEASSVCHSPVTSSDVASVGTDVDSNIHETVAAVEGNALDTAVDTTVAFTKGAVD